MILIWSASVEFIQKEFGSFLCWLTKKFISLDANDQIR